MNLHSEIERVELLSDEMKTRMFSLFTNAYDCVSRDSFEADLAWKDEVILLKDGDGMIQGFTTLAFNPKGISHPAGDLLFSGDTIINPSYWGSSELVRTFSRRAGEWQARKDRRLFWMLISKGHRTFLFLPLFSKRFFPSPSIEDTELMNIADFAAERLFGSDWNSKRGVIHFPESRGQLKRDLAETSWKRGHRPMVQFFLEKNPGFSEGDELVCLTEMDAANLKRAALDGFEEGTRKAAYCG